MTKPKLVVDNPAAPDHRRSKTLRVTRDDLDWAAGEGVITPKQSQDLWNALTARHANRPQFDLAHLFWYAGAVVVLIAMGWFVTQVADLFGWGGVLVTTLLYGGVFLFAGARLWFKENLTVPGGLLVTLSVTMAPVATHALALAIGYPDSVLDSAGYQLVLESVTIVGALAALRFFKFPFLTAPIFLSLWLMSVTVVEVLFKGSVFSLWNTHLWVTLAFGAFMMVVAFILDGRTRGDYSFWGYLFGATAFWFSLTLMDSGSEFGKLVYCGINVVLMLVSVLLARRIFLIYGALGVLGYIFHLAYTLFADSLLFPFMLTIVGVGIIVAGIQYHKHRARIDGFVLNLVPEGLRKHLPSRGE
ncbi:MAG TPA: hypothetical protein V6D17_16610 [Candidatus Obscuribacterales bacterium]